MLINGGLIASDGCINDRLDLIINGAPVVSDGFIFGHKGSLMIIDGLFGLIISFQMPAGPAI